MRAPPLLFALALLVCAPALAQGEAPAPPPPAADDALADPSEPSAPADDAPLPADDAPAGTSSARERALEERVKALEERLNALEGVTPTLPQEPPPPQPGEDEPKQGPASILQNLAERIELHGDVVGNYVWNTNDPRGPRKDRNLLRVSDPDHDTFGLVWTTLSLSRSLKDEAGWDWGFRAEFAAGRMVEETLSLDPEFNGGDEINVGEAYAELQLPTPLRVRIRLGRAYGWFGTESLHLGDSQLTTLSVLANFTPYTNTGLFVEVELLEGLSYMQYFGNGAEVVIDNNDAKTFGGRLSYEPTDTLSFALHWIWGAERNDNVHDQRWQLELDVVFEPLTGTELYAMLHLGQEQGASVNGGGVGKFGGGSLAIRQGFLREKEGADAWHKLVFMARGTVYRDQGGANTGLDQTVSEVSAGVEFAPLKFIWIRGEWRLDTSSRKDAFFGKRAVRNRRHQDTWTLAMGVKF